MFEHALGDCLTRMRLEGATPEECLAQYPQFRLEMAPLLIAAQDLGALDSLEPTAEFRSRTREKLLAHMRANPRRRDNWYGSLSFRYAASLALIFVALASTGTALAQSALPGDTLYGWKLASERIWYSLHGNPVDADIYLSGRRVVEIQAIQGRANLETIGVGAYTAVLQQLSSDLAMDPEKAIGVSEILQHQKDQLKEIFENSGADLPGLDELFGIVVLPTPNEHPQPPADNGQNPDSLLPSIVTVVPLIKKEEGQQNESNGNGDNGSDEPNNNSSNSAVEPSPAEEKPGLLQIIINSLLGGN